MPRKLSEHAEIAAQSPLILGSIKHVEAILEKEFGTKEGGLIKDEVDQLFQDLLSSVPYIGGKGNFLTENLLWSAWALALYKVLSAREYLADRTGRILHETIENLFQSMPIELKRRMGNERFFEQYIAKLRECALDTSLKKYPGNWVCTFIEGNGTFDYGYDYSECGMYKFIKSQGADELMPYLCALDFPMSRALGTGLVRTGTLAEGAQECDFRYCHTNI